MTPTEFFFFLLTTSAMFGQSITAGLTGGVPVTDTFDIGCQCSVLGVFTPKTVRYTIGGALDFRLFGPFRGEVDALYQPFSFDTSVNFAPRETFYTSHAKGSLWQFPALAKFRVPVPRLKPFVDAGPSVQLATNIHALSTSQTSIPFYGPVQVFSVHQSPNAVPGLAAGGGFEFHLRALVLAPEVRYTHWFDPNFSGFEFTYTHSKLNQVEVLLSIRIGSGTLN